MVEYISNIYIYIYVCVCVCVCVCVFMNIRKYRNKRFSRIEPACKYAIFLFFSCSGSFYASITSTFSDTIVWQQLIDEVQCVLMICVLIYKYSSNILRLLCPFVRVIAIFCHTFTRTRSNLSESRRAIINP